MPRKLAMELVTKWASLRKHTKVDLDLIGAGKSVSDDDLCATCKN